MASWCKPYGDQFLVFWFQCSSDGWDPYAGSQFTVEFQIANRPVLGLGVNRKRLALLLTEDQL